MGFVPALCHTQAVLFTSLLRVMGLGGEDFWKPDCWLSGIFPTPCFQRPKVKTCQVHSQFFVTGILPSEIVRRREGIFYLSWPVAESHGLNAGPCTHYPALPSQCSQQPPSEACWLLSLQKDASESSVLGLSQRSWSALCPPLHSEPTQMALDHQECCLEPG